MPLYTFEARTKDGKRITSVRESVNREVLIDLLQKEEYLVLSVEIAGRAQDVERKRRFVRSNVNASDLMIFSRQLSVMLDAGVTLNKALDAILKQTDSKQFFHIVSQIKKQVEGGSTFAQALASFSKHFPPIWVSMVETGEASGKLSFVLGRLSKYLELKENFKNTVLTSLFYPAILLSVAIAAAIVFVLLIFPLFDELFKSRPMELPPITKLMIALSDFLRGNILFVLVGIVVAVVLFLQVKKIKFVNRKLWELLFKLPVLGKISKVIVVERFLSQMGILVESGVPMIYALEISQKSMGNPILRDILNSIKLSVKSGSTLSRPMEKSEFFAPVVVQMVTTGEESGNLPVMLNKISEYYEEYVTIFLDRFSRLFEPFMIVFIGLGIALFVISMYLPIFQIVTLGGGV